MPRLFTHHSPTRTPGSERVFTDDHERPGSAAPLERDALSDCRVSRRRACRIPPDRT